MLDIVVNPAPHPTEDQNPIGNMDMFDDSSQLNHTQFFSPKSHQTLFCLTDWYETDLPKLYNDYK